MYLTEHITQGCVYYEHASLASLSLGHMFHRRAFCGRAFHRHASHRRASQACLSSCASHSHASHRRASHWRTPHRCTSHDVPLIGVPSSVSFSSNVSRYCLPKSYWTRAWLIMISPRRISSSLVPKGTPPQIPATRTSLISGKLDRRLAAKPAAPTFPMCAWP